MTDASEITIQTAANWIRFDVRNCGKFVASDLSSERAREIAAELIEAADEFDAEKARATPIPGGFKQGDRVVQTSGLRRRLGMVDPTVTVFGDRSEFVPVRWDDGKGAFGGGGMFPRNIAHCFGEGYVAGDRVLVNAAKARLQPTPQSGTVADESTPYPASDWVPVTLDGDTEVTHWLDENVKPLKFD